MTLPAALGALAGFRQFILWRLDGGTKVPVSPYTGYTHDAHDPAIWVSYDEARAVAPMWPGCKVAFVLTERDPLFCLDIDKAREPGGWSQLALALCVQFPGAAVEVSQSGNGLHIWGYCANPPPHGKKNVALGIELYTEKRYIALGQADGATGNVWTDQSAGVAAVVAAYFPHNGAVGGPADEAWSDSADPAYLGPLDDAQLIDLMLSAKTSAETILHGKAGLRDLWEGHADALADSWPADPSSGARWNESSADMALALHLAFWTGRNTERIRRLMELSALKRAKWTDHRRYLWITIANACATQKTIYIARSQLGALAGLTGNGQTIVPVVSSGLGAGAALALPPDNPEPIGTRPPPVDTPELVAGLQWLTANQQPLFFAGCVYVRDPHRVYVPDGAMLKPDQFRATFGGYTFSMDATNEKTTHNAWEVITESRAVKFPKVEATCFRPETVPGSIIAEEGRRLVNTYVPIDTRRIQGDAGPFTRHIAKLLPDPRDYALMIAYLAAMVQHPGIKFQWCPIIQGAEGNGKSVIVSVISYAVGHRYTHLPNAGDLAGHGAIFTGWLDRKLFIGIEEITIADRNDILEALKPLITNSRIEIQNKGVDQITGDNRANFFMCCNHKEGIAVGADKRRYGIFYSAQQSADDIERDGMGGTYFPQLYSWLRGDGYAIINDYLRTYAIPDELNPATMLQRAPETTSTAEMLALSLGPVEQEIQEVIGEGRPGFANGWISSTQFDKLLAATGRRLAHRKRRELLKNLGYDWHPGLPEGRVNNMLIHEQGKPRLFIRRGHLACNLTDHPAIVEAYCKAQGYMGAAALPMPPGVAIAPNGLLHH